MTNKELHQDTIKGLIQTTVNKTLTDLVKRHLIDERSVADWTELRSLTREIDFLYTREIGSRRETQTLENIIIEVRIRAPAIYTLLGNQEGFEAALTKGIKAYSQHIKRENLIAPLILLDSNRL